MSRRPPPMSVPLIDLRAQNAPYEEQFVEVLRDMVSSCDYGTGAAVERFEAELAELVGARHAIGVGSGTAALQLTLIGLGIGRGDEVILPANTFFATAEAVVATGARPVLVDPDLETALVSAATVEAAVTPRTAAIVGVHLYGQPVDVAGYRAVAERHRVAFVEDAAQAIGAEADGERAGAFGVGAGFSFYPAKNLGALGQGGAVTTDDEQLAREVRMLRSHGEEERYIHRRMGFNERIHGVQAAFMSIKMPSVIEGRDLRQRAATRLDELLCDIESCSRIFVRDDVRSAHHLYVVRVPDRDAVLAELQAEGVGAAIHYPIPIHLQPVWDRDESGRLPNSERLASEILSLPLWPEISDAQLEYCADVLATVLSQRTATSAARGVPS